MTIHDYLVENHRDDLTYHEGKVMFEKPLVRALESINLKLKLEEHATKVVLYDENGRRGEVPYDIHEEWHEQGKKGYYEQMYLDFQAFKLEEDEGQKF
ncbi:hypothetical protein [Caldalkalibacillus salinus]|uniref:hypothetical protein n=1 Tax=Caldalkalibacillus salinus TaxID=2803787 RepID=UPI001923D8C2|nr:hypothetical protein [Caldalkalibacillus salinus]